MSELRDLLDKIETEFGRTNRTIDQQLQLINTLKQEKEDLKIELATLKGQIIELESKWSKMQQLLKGVQP